MTPVFSGIYTIEMIVSDGVLNSNPDTVIINVASANTPPVANAGVDQSGLIVDLITLDGRASSDADGDVLTYNWTLSTLPPVGVNILFA